MSNSLKTADEIRALCAAAREFIARNDKAAAGRAKAA